MRLRKLCKELASCRLCSRLTAYIDQTSPKVPGGWCRPVPGFGDPEARLLILGLAPGLKGANRTGRPFTGDAAGIWLYKALHEVGIASAPESLSLDDGLTLEGCWLTNVVKCVPPGNKPVREEFERCRNEWLERETRLLSSVRVVLALGGDAHREVLDLYGLRPRTRFPFSHGARHKLPDSNGRILLDSYHPSRQNTNTGRLLWRDFLRVVREARKLSLSS